jgi:putative tryptophan/tyrosine transport system substrate-binding protein
LALSKVSKLSILVGAMIALGLCLFVRKDPKNHPHLPIVAVANYGPHEPLEESIQGLKDALAKQGFKEKEQILFEISHVNFEPTLIEQMLSKLKADKPAVMVVITTPVAQNAKNNIKDIPLVFSVITDPLGAGLLKKPHQGQQNITGASDKQDLRLFLQFAKKLLPEAKTLGLLYSNSEANDAALREMMLKACQEVGITMLPIAIDHPRDIPFRMQAFKNKVDFIYVGASGPIQPAVPTIAAVAEKMHIPVFNAVSDTVKQGLVLGSFGVDYYHVGVNAGNIAARILQGEKVENIEPSYPKKEDHHGYLSKKKAAQYNIVLGDDLEQTTLVE